jgi:hypothetical protein
MKKLSLIPAIIVIFALISCGGMTPKQQQLTTLGTFNGIYKQYLDEYDLQSSTVQAEWKADIDPVWKEASRAMDEYLAITDPNSTEAQQKLALYTAIKDHALALLFKYGITIKEK